MIAAARPSSRPGFGKRRGGLEVTRVGEVIGSEVGSGLDSMAGNSKALAATPPSPSPLRSSSAVAGAATPVAEGAYRWS